MILLLFYGMKLQAFIGDSFTPMLPLLLFFYPHSTILCSSVLLHCSAFFSILVHFILYPLSFLSFVLVLSLSVLVSFLSFFFTWGGLYYTLYV
ncbi:hypothetical protein PPACK8108_LOCUS7759 [Phakopsora pachyrhizi]|uniref:Uncharacterized protein n=1 Tax=Phakopsora pachyrhizi TaxID=170000 RepID=A0AAV0AY02_PHAPC|nr:hypothetical protein PPACK8108_LOCUS7759 [Phakopsora pachyrhizi]